MLGQLLRERVICEICGKDFRVKPYRIKSGVRFCSKHCHGIGMRIPLSRRLDRYTEIDETGCYPWTGGKDRGGYGVIVVNGRCMNVHRLKMEIEVGRRLCRKEEVMHTCDNPACVNINHLRLGTHLENERDKVLKGRSGKGERNSMVRFSDKQVIRILRIYAQGRYSQRQLGRIVGMSQQHISDLINGRRRAYLTVRSKF